MIHFNEETRTFNLMGATSFYAMRVNDDGRLLHIDWAPRISGDAPVVSGERQHELANHSAINMQGARDEVITFGDHTYHEVTLKVNFPSAAPEVGDHEQPYIPVRDVRLRYVDHEIVTDALPGLAPRHGHPVFDESTRETLRVTLEDPIQPLRATLCLRLTPEVDIIERWLEIENTGDETLHIEQCLFGSIHLPTGAWELTNVAGAHCDEFDTQRHTLPTGLTVTESRTLTTGHQANPFFLLNRPQQAWENSGDVYFGALAYSGAWRLTFEHRVDLTLKVHGGYNPFDFEMMLAPGERHVTPAFIHGCCADGWGGASRRLHRLIHDRVSPRPVEGPKYRPVLYNSWEACYFDFDCDDQIELARRAATIGIELFCVDDAWFGGRRHDRAGLGDWMVSPDVFPDGLKPLIDEVKRLGMTFGIWVEPEMVNADSDIYRAHPDWILHFAGRPRTEARHQLILDFGREEVVENIFNQLDALASDHDIAFFKWDMNRSPTEPGSVVGKAIWRRHVEGVYSVMDRLRAKHPGLDIQSCSAGGGRIDAGMMGRVDQVWTSDETDALDRVRIQEGYSLAYPARAMECWVTNEENHQTGRRLGLDLRFDVAMRGALGIGSNIEQLDEAELEEYASHIAFYKQIRHIVQDGCLHRLQRQEEHGCSAIQYTVADQSESVVSIAVVDHKKSEIFPPIRLRGLDPDAIYVLADRHGNEPIRSTGRELMGMGIPLKIGGGRLSYGYSRTWWVMKTANCD